METPLTREIYDHSPVCLQHLFTTAFGWKKRLGRFGRHYREYRRFFEASAGWSRAELEAFQNEKLAALIRDAYVDMTFGTGGLKVTPAHDPNDFEIGRRHNLPEVKVMPFWRRGR